METWEWMAGWSKKIYAEDLFRQSGELAKGRLVRAQNAWRQFGLIPVDFLKTSTGKTDPEAFKSMSAFLMYHWDAGQMTGLSLSNALCGQYNAGFTLLRSYLELVLRGVFFQCLAQRKFRESPSRVLKPTEALSILTSNLSTVIRQKQIDDTDFEKNSMLIFDVLRGHWMQDILRLDLGSIARQIDDWGMIDGLEEKPAEIIGELYGQLSQNVHERVEYTDSGRAVEEGAGIFEWPSPILSQSLSEFLDDFHLAMEVGVIAVLHQLAYQIPYGRLRGKCQQLLDNEAFKLADLRRTTKLLNRWIVRRPG
jgi:hypothetical protein